jgi:hypothetical protein
MNHPGLRLLALASITLSGSAAQAAAPAPAAAPTTAPAPAPTTAAPKAPAAPPPAGAKPAAATPPSTPAPKVPPPLPPARSADLIITDMIAAVGGAEALGRHKSMHTKMEITFKGLGITGTAEHWAAVGDKTLTTTAIPSVATSREGSDGTRFWSEDQINGLRILEGAEAEQARIEAAWNAELRMKELFLKIEAKNEPDTVQGGGYLECLVLTPKTGGPITDCFDPKTHLMVLQKGVRSGPQGEMPYTARMSDWRPVGDVKLAYATEMQVGPLGFTGKVLSAEVDVAIDPKLFAVPGAANAGAGGPTEKARPTKAATKKAAPTTPAPPAPKP